MPLKDKSNRCQYLRDWKAINREKNLFQQAQHRAKTKGIAFDIEVSDIVIPKICPILGLPLKKSVDGNRDLSPSLDRIDNSKGYIKGNVITISRLANTMKNDSSADELKLFCTNVIKNKSNL
jgi:hypothetical protein